jgi:hypothetical protein
MVSKTIPTPESAEILLVADHKDVCIKQLAYSDVNVVQPDLRSFPCDSIENRLVCTVGEATLYASLLIFFITRGKAFGTVVERVAKRFMDALEIGTSHEDLKMHQL